MDRNRRRHVRGRSRFHLALVQTDRPIQTLHHRLACRQAPLLRIQFRGNNSRFRFVRFQLVLLGPRQRHNNLPNLGAPLFNPAARRSASGIFHGEQTVEGLREVGLTSSNAPAP